MSSKQLTLVMVNESPTFGSMMVYTQSPDLGDLAAYRFINQPVHPTTQASFSWNDQAYGFTWVQNVAPVDNIGITTNLIQLWPADESQNNQVTLTQIDDAYTFKDQTKAEIAGSLVIVQDSTVGSNAVQIGVSFAGSPVFVVASEPNVTATFTPKIDYWIVFGYTVVENDIIINTTTKPQQLVFPSGYDTITAVLDADYHWQISPSAAVGGNQNQASAETLEIAAS
ncbi:hypothetical protein [Herpetosiphon gulosus]|uniref:Protein RhiA n=1 Tax=Herpetosiphon gulosus TaxID=1973496 RepID=A0ABP9X3W7_9CHLR